MSLIISEDIVEETWQEIIGYSSEQANEEMDCISRIQPNLYSFITEFTYEMGPEISGMAVCIMFCIYRMYQRASRFPVRRISIELIESCYEANEDHLEKLNHIHERFLERMARVQLAEQPYVMRYILETLFDSDNEEINLKDEDIGYLFVVFKTIIDVLGNVVGSPEE